MDRIDARKLGRSAAAVSRAVASLERHVMLARAVAAPHDALIEAFDHMRNPPRGIDCAARKAAQSLVDELECWNSRATKVLTGSPKLSNLRCKPVG